MGISYVPLFCKYWSIYIFFTFTLSLLVNAYCFFLCCCLFTCLHLYRCVYHINNNNNNIFLVPSTPQGSSLGLGVDLPSYDPSRAPDPTPVPSSTPRLKSQAGIYETFNMLYYNNATIYGIQLHVELCM